MSDDVEALRKEVARTRRALSQLYFALAFYADPQSYHAISILADRPAGAFADDFSFDEEYDRDMPGKLARETLDKFQVTEIESP